VLAKKIPFLFCPLNIKYPAMTSEIIRSVIVSKTTATISEIVVSIGVWITVIAELRALSVGHGFPWSAKAVIVSARKIKSRMMLVIFSFFAIF